MTKFLLICQELFDFACKVNADAKYKWHKNLQMCENQLKRLKFHVEKCLSLISCIDSEHLDYETQMRRLRDVHARFQPLMSRIDNSLGVIQHELNLPTTHRQSLDNPTGHSVATNVNSASDNYHQGTNGTYYNDNRNSYQQITENDRRPPSGTLALRDNLNTSTTIDNSTVQSIAGSKSSQHNRTSHSHSMPLPPTNLTSSTNTTAAMPITPGGIFSRGQSPDTIPSNHSNPLSPISQSPVNDRNYANTAGIAQQNYGEMSNYTGNGSSGNGHGNNNNNIGGYVVEEVDSDNEADAVAAEDGTLVIREGHSSTVCVIS